MLSNHGLCFIMLLLSNELVIPKHDGVGVFMNDRWHIRGVFAVRN